MADSAFFLHFAEGAHVHSVATLDKVNYGRVLRSAWSYFLTGFLVYAVNLSVYPGLTSLGKWSLVNVAACSIVLLGKSACGPCGLSV
jgi:hypothetical protein